MELEREVVRARGRSCGCAGGMSGAGGTRSSARWRPRRRSTAATELVVVRRRKGARQRLCHVSGAPIVILKSFS
jgi:hypothetical protein